MKFYHYLITVFIFLSSNLFSQNAKITGKVTEESKEALISANVVIDASKGWAAVTDFDGNYSIDIPAGSYEISFRYIGKDEQKIKVTVAPGEKKVLNVMLKEKQQIMDIVVISGSKYEQKLGEQTVSMDVLKGTSLANDNITNLEGGMTKVPGVTIADGQVNIRGGSGWSYGAGSRVQVLVDDLPILTADASDAKWDIVPMENVDQVEVIKGAASALYGSGALNGVINVRTAYPTDEPYFKVSTYGGIYDRPSRTPDMAIWWQDKWGRIPPNGEGVNVAYRQKIGQSDLVIGGAFDGSTGFVDSSDGHEVRGNLKYRYRFKKISGLNMGINVSGYYSWGKTFFFWKGIDSLAYQPYPHTITVYKSYRFTVDPFIDYYDKHDNQFKFVGRFFNATNTNNTGQGSVPNKYYAELQYHRRLKFKKFDLNVVGGIVNNYDDVAPPKGSTGSLFGKNSGYNFSAYAQTDFKILQKLTISFGARWEYFTQKHYTQDSSGNEHLALTQNSLKQLPYPLARLGINYQATEATYIRASFGQGFRYPTIAERYITTQVGPLYISSNPNLNPEKGYSAELGIKQGFKMGKDWYGFADLSGFWNQYDNMMEFTFGQFGDSAQWHTYDSKKNIAGGLGFSSQNIGKTRILGTEFVLGGQGKLGQVGLQFVFGYTYIDPRSLNWNSPLTMYNYQGVPVTSVANLNVQLGPGIYTVLPLNIYNQANNPNPGSSQMTYGMTSSSSSNLLKYRNKHTFKADLTMTWKGIEVNTNLQYSSFMENIDYAFIGPAFQFIGGPAFGGLAQLRNEKMNIPIGKGRGDIVWNMHVAYAFTQGIRVAFLVKNLLNWEYTPRPASFAEPRSFQLQLSYTMQPRKKKQTSEHP